MSKVLWAMISATFLIAYANDEYAGQFNYGQTKEKGKSWVQSIQVISPAYRTDVSGTVKITFKAPGMELAEARCWHQPDAEHPGVRGYDAVVMPARKITGTQTSFEFKADEFPHGPTNIRISTKNSKGQKDVCELQLFNTGGVKWKQGLPKAPSAAKGMRLVFADDFDKTPKISPQGDDATYSAHKPNSGDFSGYRFSHKDDYPGAHDPFEQRGTWLRIKARGKGSQKTRGSGLIASKRFDGTGVVVHAPSYFECRFVAQSAPGTWPAFWTLGGRGGEWDELDIIEGYGGVGRGNPNASDYHIVTHLWGQKDPNGKKKKGFHRVVPMMEMGGKSFWSSTAHTYAVKIGLKETVYYFDNEEVLRHPTGSISASEPAFFLINYAIGGISGWKIDLKRYGYGTDMWVDYVRVYSGRAPKAEIVTDGVIFDQPAKVVLKSSTPEAKIHYTTNGSEPTSSSPIYTEALSIKTPCTVKAITIAEGLLPSKVSTMPVERARSADTPESAKPGLVCTYYEGKWLKLPDFTKLSPVNTSTETNFDFPKKRKSDHFGLIYTGYLEVPEDAAYTFYTRSDDGSQLYIGGRLVVDNDGAHGAIEKSGRIGLRKGRHAIEVRYFEAWGGDSLIVNWAGSKRKKTLIPSNALSH